MSAGEEASVRSRRVPGSTCGHGHDREADSACGLHKVQSLLRVPGVRHRHHEGISAQFAEEIPPELVQKHDSTERVRIYSSDSPVRIGPLEVAPFLTVHDAVDPVAVTVTEALTGQKLGVATDLGRPTATVRSALQGCDMLVLEANYDDLLLRESVYPWSVKARIASSHGHLSNRAAAELATELSHAGLACVVLAHLSERANDPGLAEAVVGEALHRARFRGSMLTGKQHEPLPPIDVAAKRNRLLPEQLPLL